jgi:hypothetical protein
MKTLILAVTVALSAWSQGAPVNQVQGPPPNNDVFIYDIASTPQYTCVAASFQPTTTFYKATNTLSQIAVATNVATATFSGTSYLWVGAQVVVAGSTTAALNGTYKVTAVSGSTATFTTSGVADATYNNTALTLSTQAPLLNAAVWSIQITQYSAGSPVGSYWAGPPSIVPPRTLACSNRANY